MTDQQETTPEETTNVKGEMVTVKVNPDKNKSLGTAYTVRYEKSGKTVVRTIRNEVVSKPVQVPREHELVDQLLANKLILEVR